MSQFYVDDDADLSLIGSMTIAILGYGNQGRSQALNMQDNGLEEPQPGLYAQPA